MELKYEVFGMLDGSELLGLRYIHFFLKCVHVHKWINMENLLVSRSLDLVAFQQE